MSYPEQKHPDAVAKMLNDLAIEHGYVLVSVEIINLRSEIVSVLPRYTYGEYVSSKPSDQEHSRTVWRDVYDPRTGVRKET